MLFSATRIHNGREWLPQGSVLEMTDDGTVIAVHRSSPGPGLTHYDGILCPGFVNAHCHLELSHMKGAIEEGTGLTGFLLQVMRRRNDFTDIQKQEAREQAREDMMQGGVVAVGDIANTTDTLSLREKGGLHWHTFVESIGFLPERAATNFAYAVKTWEAFEAQTAPGNVLLRQSIVPHAPYSVSQELFRLIAAHQEGVTLSVHNQETEDENHYYRSKTGGFSAFLQAIGIDDGIFSASGKSSLMTYSEWLKETSPLMLVHNTFSPEEDIRAILQKFPKLYWCLCPNANLYIENRLPDIALLDRLGAVLCIGTDSLASNHQLSVWSEIQAIQTAYPQIALEKLLRWACYHGACALQMEERIGSIEAGKQPGLVWIKEDNSVQRLF